MCEHWCHTADLSAVRAWPKGVNAKNAVVISCRDCWREHPHPKPPEGKQEQWEYSLTSNLPLIMVAHDEEEIEVQITVKAEAAPTAESKTSKKGK